MAKVCPFSCIFAKQLLISQFCFFCSIFVEAPNRFAKVMQKNVFKQKSKKIICIK